MPVKAKRIRIIRFARIFVYSFLFLILCDYFLHQPARLTSEDLPSPPPELKPLANRLQSHVAYLASPELSGRAPGTPGNAAAEQYILGFFKEVGLVPPSPAGPTVQIISADIGRNVFSALPTVRSDREWILLGAHFDHLGLDGRKVYLGADDNASSVAILLETARQLQQSGPLDRFNLLFVGFNSEEPPYLLTQNMGSIYFYRHMEETGIDPKKIRLAVIMDLMGGVFWEPLQDVIFVMGAEKTPSLESLVSSLTFPGLSTSLLGMPMIEKIPGEGRRIFSDYEIFNANKIPFLFLSAGRTPHYHRPGDTAQTLHYTRMARTVLWLENLIRKIDKGNISWSFQQKRNNTLQDLNTLLPLIEQAAVWNSKIPQTGLISLYKLKTDRKKLRSLEKKYKSGQPPTSDDITALALASIRIQCLLGKMGPCFLLSGNS